MTVAAQDTLLDLLPVQAWHAAPDGALRFQNRACRAAGAGLAWTVALHPDDVLLYRASWPGLLAAPAPAELELRLRQPGGHYRWFLVRMAPGFDVLGQLEGWYGTNTDIDGLKQAVCCLADENTNLREEFRDLFDEAPIAYVHEAMDTRFIRANRAALDMLGLQPEEAPQFVGRSLLADTPANQDRLNRASAMVQDGVAVAGVEIELRRKDNGKPVWVQWWSRPVEGKQYTRTMLVDITSRVQAERSAATLAFSLASGLIGDWDLDLVRHTSHRSLRHDQCFGYDHAIPHDQWGVREFLDHVHRDDRAHVAARFQAMIDGRQSLDEEFRVTWPDGSLHWLAVRGSAYGPGQGIATRLVGTVMDVTARKQDEEVLRETQAMLAFTLASASVGDWDLDLVHDTSRRSLRHDQLFGYEQAIAQDAWGIDVFLAHIHPLDRERTGTGMRAAIASQRDWGDTFRVIWPDGSIHWLETRGSFYYHAPGNRATRMLGIVTDITARKRSAEALATSEQLARGQVAALRQTLDALSLDDTPDRLVQHISRTITFQMEAHSNSLWRRNASNGRIGFEFAYEGGAFLGKADHRLAGASLWLPMEDALPWPAPLRAGQHCLVDDIRAVPAFALRDRLVEMGIVTVLMVPMLESGVLEGVIVIRYAHKRLFRPEEIAFATTLANQAVLALKLARLSSERRDAAVIAERNRMARAIHDTLAQGFAGVIVQLEAAADAGVRGRHGETAVHIGRAGTLARDSLAEARRSVRDLRPQALEERRVADALPAMFDKLTAATGLAARFAVLGTPRLLPAEWEDNLLRIGQEVLTNVLRHASATVLAAELAFTAGRVRLTMRDDGIGFDAGARHDGFGLLGIRERTEQMGGQLRIDSAPGAGTAITVDVPLAPDGNGAPP